MRSVTLCGSYALPVHSGGNRLGLSPNFPCYPDGYLLQLFKERILNSAFELRHSMAPPRRCQVGAGARTFVSRLRTVSLNVATRLPSRCSVTLKVRIAFGWGSVQGAVATWSNPRGQKSLGNIACSSLTRSLPLPVLTRTKNDSRLLRQSVALCKSRTRR